MTTKRWLLCGAMAVGVLAQSALSGHGQERAGLSRPEGGLGVEESELSGPGERPGFPDAMMRGGPGLDRPGGQGGFQPGAQRGPGMRGGPMGPDGAVEGRLDPEIRQRLEKEMKLRRHVDELTRKYRETGEKDAAKAEIEKALGRLLDVQLSNQEQRAKKLQEKAARIQESVAKARANRDKLIGRRLAQLVEAGDWGW